MVLRILFCHFLSPSIMALIKYPNTKVQPDFQKNPAAVFAASPNEVQSSIENGMSVVLIPG
jgi:hypothetical protein